MRFVAVAALTILLSAACSNETAVPTQPTHDITMGVPPGWRGSTSANVTVGIDRTARRSGKSGLYLSVSAPVANAAALVIQYVRAEQYRGKRLRLSGWVTHTNVNGPAAGVFMGVEAPMAITAYDDMRGRSVSGTASEWHQIAVVLDVAKNAERLWLGASIEGQGQLYVDDLRLEEVGLDVPTTNIYAQPQPTTTDSATLAASSAPLPDVPSNLDFEFVLAPSQESIDWMVRHAAALTTSDPAAPFTDLAPLKSMISDAHVVGLGEATHGTREFFRMKHRMLAYLVQEMGFTRFAIEASAPDANNVNHYVLTGEGDPKVLLSRMYFWIYNTQEVLDMIVWMRNWNSRASPSQQVQFLGIDIQFPGASMDSVASYLTRMDSTKRAFVDERFMCLSPFRNRGEIFGLGPAFYGARASDTEKLKCARGLREIDDTLRAQRAAYVARSSLAEFEVRAHDIRLVQQFEATASVSGSTAAGGRERDKYMAENVRWIRDQAPPGARIAVWAHNGHVARGPASMGTHLQTSYGADYVSLGFTFGRGSFNAIGPTGPAKPWTALQIPGNSIEAVFSATTKFSSLVDMRAVAAAGATAGQLRDGVAMRRIGATFDPSSEGAYFYPVKFPDEYDLLMYFENTAPSMLLPFVYR